MRGCSLVNGCNNPPETHGHVFPRDDNRATAAAAQVDVTDQWWKRYFGNSARSRQRAYFSGGKA